MNLFYARRADFEDRSPTVGDSALISRSVEIAFDCEQARKGILSVLAALKTVQNAFGTRGAHFKNGSGTAGTALIRRAVQHSIEERKTRPRMCTVVARIETVDDFFDARRGDFEDRAPPWVDPALVRRPVEHAVDCDELAVRILPVVAALEAVDYMLQPGGRDFENGAIAASSALIGRAVKRAVNGVSPA